MARHARAAAFGIIAWAIGVGVVAYLSPGHLVSVVSTTPPMLLSGSIMLTMALCIAVFRLGVAALDRVFVPERSELTEWDG